MQRIPIVTMLDEGFEGFPKASSIDLWNTLQADVQDKSSGERNRQWVSIHVSLFFFNSQ
jgi:hypothetical protein